jgi:hypothetical protein
MGSKIDGLEKNTNDLEAEMGTEMPAKKPDDAKPSEIGEQGFGGCVTDFSVICIS